MAFKSGVKKVPMVKRPPQRPSFVLGSRPPSLRAPRIKPLMSGGQDTRNYAKLTNPQDIGPAGFGQTGLTGES